MRGFDRCPKEIQEMCLHLKSTGTGDSKLQAIIDWVLENQPTIEQFIKYFPKLVPALTALKILRWLRENNILSAKMEAMMAAELPAGFEVPVELKVTGASMESDGTAEDEVPEKWDMPEGGEGSGAEDEAVHLAVEDIAKMNVTNGIAAIEGCTCVSDLENIVLLDSRVGIQKAAQARIAVLTAE